MESKEGGAVVEEFSKKSVDGFAWSGWIHSVGFLFFSHAAVQVGGVRFVIHRGLKFCIDFS